MSSSVHRFPDGGGINNGLDLQLFIPELLFEAALLSPALVILEEEAVIRAAQINSQEQ